MMKISLALLATMVVAAADNEWICPNGALFWPAVDCRQYYLCNNGNPILRTCPFDYLWNHLVTACDFPENVSDCQSGSRPPMTWTTTISTTEATSTPNLTTIDAIRTTTIPTTTTVDPIATTTAPTTTTVDPTTYHAAYYTGTM